MELLTTTHSNKISGILSCFDRVIITGTLPQVCHSKGMTSYLYSKGVRIFDYPKFAEPFKNELRNNAEQLAKDNGIEIAIGKRQRDRNSPYVCSKISYP